MPQGLVGTEEDMSDESDSELDGDDGGEGALEPAEVAAAEPAKKKKRFEDVDYSRQYATKRRRTETTAASP